MLTELLQLTHNKKEDIAMISRASSATKTVLSALLLFSISTHAADISGLWYGVAPSTDGNTDYDHQTILVVSATPQSSPSKITYIYPALGLTCHSDLLFNNLESIGVFPNIKRVWTFDDDTQSAGCIDGKVCITAPLHIATPLNSVYFEWVDLAGHVDNAGMLERLDLPLP